MYKEDTLVDKILYGSLWLIANALANEIALYVIVSAVFFILGVFVGAKL